MIRTTGKTFISIRDIKFDGAAHMEGQKRGENLVEIHYQILTKELDPEQQVQKFIVVKDKTLVLNGQFGDADFAEALLFIKKFAIEAIHEDNHDEKRELDEAIKLIEQQTPKSAVEATA